MTWEVEERKKGENCGGAVSFAFLSSSLHLREIISFRRVACLACSAGSSQLVRSIELHARSC
jgi:hypothetical protein